MPRRPQEHLDARRRQILDAARRCFIRNGFHATSMQDVLAEAELSVGAVYRYFKGKDDIIAAIAAEAIAEVASAFAAHDTDELPQLDDIVDLVLAVEKPPLAGSPESARLLVQIWSEALRSPALATQLTDVMAATRRVRIGRVDAGVPLDLNTQLPDSVSQQLGGLPLGDAQVHRERRVHRRRVQLGQQRGALVEVQRSQRDAALDRGCGDPHVVQQLERACHHGDRAAFLDFLRAGVDYAGSHPMPGQLGRQYQAGRPGAHDEYLVVAVHSHLLK